MVKYLNDYYLPLLNMVQKTVQEIVENYEESAKNLICSSKLALGEASTSHLFRGENLTNFEQRVDEISNELKTKIPELKEDFKEEFFEFAEKPGFYPYEISEKGFIPGWTRYKSSNNTLVEMTHLALNEYRKTGDQTILSAYLTPLFKNIENLPKSKHLITSDNSKTNYFKISAGKIGGAALTGGLAAGYAFNSLLSPLTGSEEIEKIRTFFSTIGGGSVGGLILVGLNLYALEAKEKYNSVMNTARKIQDYATMFSKNKNHKS